MKVGCISILNALYKPRDIAHNILCEQNSVLCKHSHKNIHILCFSLKIGEKSSVDYFMKS